MRSQTAGFTRLTRTRLLGVLVENPRVVEDSKENALAVEELDTSERIALVRGEEEWQAKEEPAGREERDSSLPIISALHPVERGADAGEL